MWQIDWSRLKSILFLYTKRYRKTIYEVKHGKLKKRVYFISGTDILNWSQMDRGTWKFYLLQDIAKTVSFTDFCNKLLMWSRGGKMTGIKNTKVCNMLYTKNPYFTLCNRNSRKMDYNECPLRNINFSILNSNFPLEHVNFS